MQRPYQETILGPEGGVDIPLDGRSVFHTVPRTYIQDPVGLLQGLG
jgi:hypothetical protein